MLETRNILETYYRAMEDTTTNRLFKDCHIPHHLAAGQKQAPLKATMIGKSKK